VEGLPFRHDLSHQGREAGFGFKDPNALHLQTN
jgi:hypothetical protein